MTSTKNSKFKDGEKNRYLDQFDFVNQLQYISLIAIFFQSFHPMQDDNDTKIKAITERE